MGFEIALAVGALVGGALIFGLGRGAAETDDMKPAGLDAFSSTRSSEGQAVPLVFGKVRIPSTLLWYGNLESEPVYQESGGKGGMLGGPKAVQGYKYWLDLWHAICQGPDVTLHNVYINDKEHELTELPVSSYTFNPGDTNDYPTEPGAYASPMKGLAHVFLDRYLVGVNVTTVPTLHFVVSRSSTAPLTYANETNGINPAALIWELLVEAEVPTAAIDTASFEDAATYWHGKGYGLNVVFDRQAKLKDHINSVLTYVDACLRDDGQKFYLIAFKDTDTAADTITTDEFQEFTFARRTWDDVFTDFRGSFTDEDADFTTRVVRVRNSAVRALVGHDNQKSIDLTWFRDLDAAQTRLWDIMKRLSYPEAQLKCTVSMRYAAYNVGQVLGITHSDYSLSGALYRITKKQESAYDKNSVDLELSQVLEPLLDHDEAAPTAGGTSWVQTHYTAEEPSHQRVVELPYTTQHGEAPAYLCLCARQNIEDGFGILRAVVSGGDYAVYGYSSRFSQYGALAEEYPASTYSIDDEVGIRFTPDREDPVFSTISRAALFGTGRIAVLVHSLTGAFEVVAFQTVTPIAQSADVRLEGVIRGLMNTTPQTWATATTEVWLTDIGDNVVTGITDGRFYLKFVPFFYGQEADESLCTEMTVNYVGRARTPWPPALVKVTRSGSNLTAIVWPTTRTFAGAGTTDGAGGTHGSASGQTDQWPPDFVGSFEYTTDAWSTTTAASSYTWGYSSGSAHSLQVRALANGYRSDDVSVVVGAGDGDYYGEAE